MSRPFFLLACAALAATVLPAAALPSQSPLKGAVKEATAGDTAGVRLPVMKQSLPTAKAIKPAARLKVHFDGRVVAGEKVLFAPTKSDERKALRAWLKAKAEKMERKAVASAPEFGELPNGLLLLSCDETASMVHLQALLADCVAIDTPIWRVHLETLRVEGEGDDAKLLPGRLDVSLIHEDGPEEREESEGPTAAVDSDAAPEIHSVVVQVKAPGAKLTVPMGEPWGGDANEQFYYDRSTRDLLYRWGPRKMTDTKALGATMAAVARMAKAEGGAVAPLIIDTREGTTVSDAALVMGVAMSHGFDKFGFTAAR